jgi:hypothetical protein
MVSSSHAVSHLNTELTCISCGDDLEPAQEVFLATICYALEAGDFYDELEVLDEEEKAPAFEPLFFDLDCWDEVTDGLNEIVEDEPPEEHNNALLRCHFCASGILQLERYSRIRLGELHLSPRRPNGEMTFRFVETGPRSQVMCLSCMTHVSCGILEIWEDVTQEGECGDCAHARCWREDKCPLECACHEE